MRLLATSVITFIVIYLLTFFIINVVFALDNTNLVSGVSMILFGTIYVYYRFILKRQ